MLIAECSEDCNDDISPPMALLVAKLNCSDPPLPPSRWLQVFQNEVEQLLRDEEDEDAVIGTAFEMLLARIEDCPDDRDVITARRLLDALIAERGGEGRLVISETEPMNGKLIGKTIKSDGDIEPYPYVRWWRWRMVRLLPTIDALIEYLIDGRERNICLGRGQLAPGNPLETRSQNARPDRDAGKHGFIDAASRFFPIDIDKIAVDWSDGLQGAVERILQGMGEPWCSTSCVWFATSSHGLKKDEDGLWRGEIDTGVARLRPCFITTRAINEAEAKTLTAMVAGLLPSATLDPRIVLRRQPNYIRRPQWLGHEGEDVLGDIGTIGLVRRQHEYLQLPDDLTQRTEIDRAEGLHDVVAHHPDAETAVHAIGSDGSVRTHLMAAVKLLLQANPMTQDDDASLRALANDIVTELQAMVAAHRDEIDANLKACGRPRSDATKYLPDNMREWAFDHARWMRDHPTTANVTWLKVTEQEGDGVKVDTEDVYRRVTAIINRFIHPRELTEWEEYCGLSPDVVLLNAPPGGRKSTEIRRLAVEFTMAHPDENVLILIDRHKLGDEQIEDLRREHPNAPPAATWRGRLAEDPDAKPREDGLKTLMCLRPHAMQAVQDDQCDAEFHMCKQGRGKNVIECPLLTRCGFWGQKEIVAEARIIYAAHEVAVHELPKAFGKIGLVIFDESPLDAFIFGVEKPVMALALDALLEPPPATLDVSDAEDLQCGRIPRGDAMQALPPAWPLSLRLVR